MIIAEIPVNLYDSLTNKLAENVEVGQPIGYPADAPIKRKVKGKMKSCVEVYRYETHRGQTVQRFFYYVP